MGRLSGLWFPNLPKCGKQSTWQNIPSRRTWQDRDTQKAEYCRFLGSEGSRMERGRHISCPFSQTNAQSERNGSPPCRACGGEKFGLSDSHTKTPRPYRSVNPEQGFDMARYKPRQALGSLSLYEVLISRLSRRLLFPYRTDAFDSCLR